MYAIRSYYARPSSSTSSSDSWTSEGETLPISIGPLVASCAARKRLSWLAWADVQAAFQERANLVPNLAEVAKGAAEQEKAIRLH